MQARARLLEHAELPQCEQLHLLQMACEKVCKAYLCGRGVEPEMLMASHAYIASTLPLIAREQFAREGKQLLRDRSWMLRAIRVLARRIEMLAPSVDDGGRNPSNCEYPWQGADGQVVAPAEYDFHLNLLYEPGGRHLMKALFRAIDELVRESNSAGQ